MGDNPDKTVRNQSISVKEYGIQDSEAYAGAVGDVGRPTPARSERAGRGQLASAKPHRGKRTAPLQRRDADGRPADEPARTQVLRRRRSSVRVRDKVRPAVVRQGERQACLRVSTKAPLPAPRSRGQCATSEYPAHFYTLLIVPKACKPGTAIFLLELIRGNWQHYVMKRYISIPGSVMHACPTRKFNLTAIFAEPVNRPFAPDKIRIYPLHRAIG